MSSLLVRMFGFPATLVHGDTSTLDRWRWLKDRLPIVEQGSRSLLDIGCGTGAFTIGAARRGYSSLGLSWDVRNQTVAGERARLCKAPLATFEVLDVRQLHTRTDLYGLFDIVVCCENIEHILNDSKLMLDMSRCLKAGGKLLLTTPNFNYKAITPEDDGPFPEVETGWHVRRGYTEADLRRLSGSAGLDVLEIDFCMGFFSQKITYVMRRLSRKIHPLVGWVAILPLRILPPLLDPIVSRMSSWPAYSITLIAQKPVSSH